MESTLLDDLNIYSVNLVLVILCVNVLLFSLKFKQLNTPFKHLYYYLLLNLAIEISAIIFISCGLNNLPLLHIYTLGEFILFSHFFRSIIVKPSLFQKRYWYFVGIGTVLIIANSLFIQSIFEFNTFAKSFVQITIISYCVFYFYNLLEGTNYSQRSSRSLRLLISGIIIYYSGSLFIFMFSRTSFGNEEPYIFFWVFNSLLNVIFHVMIFTALWNEFYKKER